MIHRLHYDVAAMAVVVPVQLAQLNALTSQVHEYANPNATTWERFVGQHGALAISLMVSGIFILMFILAQVREARRAAQNRLDAMERIKKEDERQEQNRIDRERQHAEALAASTHNAEKIEGMFERVAELSAEQAKVGIIASHAVSKLEEELKKRPCWHRNP